MDAQAVMREAGADGRFFGVTFVKKDGTVRDMLCRFGVRIGVSGVGSNYDPALHGLVVVWDVAIRNFRSVRLRDVLEVRGRGKIRRLKNLSAYLSAGG